MASNQDSNKESSLLKKEACENCMEKLKGTLSADQLKQFEDAFHEAAEEYTFERKEYKR